MIMKVWMTILTTVTALELTLARDSEIESINITLFQKCVDDSGMVLGLHTVWYEHVGLESVTVYQPSTLNDESAQPSGEEQQQRLNVVFNCLEKQGLSMSMGYSDRRQELKAAQEAKVTQNRSETASEETASLMARDENNGPADSRGGPTRSLGSMSFLLYQGPALLSKVVEKFGGLHTGTCYSYNAQIGGGFQIVNADNFEVDIMVWPHHCCRSRSKDGSNYGPGQVIKTASGRRSFHSVRVGSWWVQASSSIGWPGPDTGSVDANPCVQIGTGTY